MATLTYAKVFFSLTKEVDVKTFPGEHNISRERGTAAPAGAHLLQDGRHRI
jgi:hypothetical protein